MTPSEDPIRVAVIGGGCAALTAAFELTRPELNGRWAAKAPQGVAWPGVLKNTGCISGWASTKMPSA
jgi:thioredoxin reductase